MLQVARVTASVVVENEAVLPLASETAVLLEGCGAVVSVAKVTFSVGKVRETSSQVAKVTMSVVDDDKAALLVANETDLLVDEADVVPSVARSTALIDDMEELVAMETALGDDLDEAVVTLVGVAMATASSDVVVEPAVIAAEAKDVGDGRLFPVVMETASVIDVDSMLLVAMTTASVLDVDESVLLVTTETASVGN